MKDRDLDALVAEKVMGECLWSVFRRDGQSLREDWPDAKDHGLRYSFQSREQAYAFLEERGGAEVGAVMKPSPEPYSSTGDGMLAVIEAMRAKGFFLTVSDAGSDTAPRMIVRFRDATWLPREYAPICGEIGWMDHGGSLPRAVCLAALKAVGEEVGA